MANRNVGILTLALAAVTCVVSAGCTNSRTKLTPALDPQPLQRFPTPDKAATENARAAATRQVLAYFAAQKDAEDHPTDTGKLGGYRDAGIALVNSYCRSWFAQLDDYSRNLSRTRSNHGVLTALGTALIGIGKLDADVTAVYGALNTAYTGALDSAAKNYLFSASSTTVENKVFTHLNERAREIRANTPGEFGQLRNVLEGYERICTYKHAAALVEESVKSTDTKVDENGSISAVAFSTDEGSDAVRALWKPDGVTVNDEFAKYSRTWLGNNGIKVGLTSFIYGAPYADARRALLAAYAQAKAKKGATP